MIEIVDSWCFFFAYLIAAVVYPMQPEQEFDGEVIRLDYCLANDLCFINLVGEIPGDEEVIQCGFICGDG